MSPKVLLGSVAAGIVLVVGLYMVVSPHFKNASESSSYEDRDDRVPETELSTVSSEQVTESIALPTEAVPQNANTEIVPETVSIPADPSPHVEGYTAAEVATHNGEASCWSIINGTVYDLTSFIPKHPGGDRNILKICGVDGTRAFEGQHGGDAKPETTLAKFRIGAVI